MPAKKTYLRRYLTGLTLVEAIVTILVLAVIVIGTAGYRYYATLDERRSVKEATAARIALLLNEAWRGQDANSTYDPYNQLQDIFATLGTSPPVITKDPTGAPAGPTGTGWKKLGSYQVTAGNANYFIIMSYGNDTPAVEHKDYSGTWGTSSWLGIVRIPINTTVAWPVTTAETSYDAANYWEFSLTTYVEEIMW